MIENEAQPELAQFVPGGHRGRKVFSYRMAPEVDKRLHEYAADNGYCVSHIVEFAVEEFLNARCS